MILLGQCRPWSDCADAQSDQGLCCPQKQKDTFLRGTADRSIILDNLGFLYFTGFTSLQQYFSHLHGMVR